MTLRILGRNAPSVKSLMQIKDVTREDADRIREIWHTVPNRKEAREAVNKVLNTSGVEYLGFHKRNKVHVYYANAGDTYATTLIFLGPRMVVGCWGDYTERNTVCTGDVY